MIVFVRETSSCINGVLLKLISTFVYKMILSFTVPSEIAVYNFKSNSQKDLVTL